MIKAYLSCLLLIVSNANAQNPAKEQPLKKANKIIVFVNDSANTLLDRIAGILYDKGYTIENKDEKVKFISTKEREGKKWTTYYKVRARIVDTAIVFTAGCLEIKLFILNSNYETYSFDLI